jgi:hypothetical protein
MHFSCEGCTHFPCEGLLRAALEHCLAVSSEGCMHAAFAGGMHVFEVCILRPRAGKPLIREAQGPGVDP